MLTKIFRVNISVQILRKSGKMILRFSMEHHQRALAENSCSAAMNWWTFSLTTPTPSATPTSFWTAPVTAGLLTTRSMQGTLVHYHFSFTCYKDQLVYPSVKGFCTKIMKWTFFLKQQNLTNFSMNSTISQAVHASVNRALEGSSPTNNKPTGVKQVRSLS